MSLVIVRSTPAVASVAGDRTRVKLLRRTSFEELRQLARFTKYLTAILRLSYDNAKVTIDLRRT